MYSWKFTILGDRENQQITTFQELKLFALFNVLLQFFIF